MLINKEHETTNTKQTNIMKQSQINENKAQLSTQPSCGRGSKKYRKPSVEWIPLDNAISLALASTPPGGPGETYNATTPTYLSADPFKFTIS